MSNNQPDQPSNQGSAKAEPQKKLKVDPPATPPEKTKAIRNDGKDK